MTSFDPALEQHVTRPNGRILAYTTSGNPASSSLVVFFHGFFGIGRTSDKDIPKALQARGFRYATPTLPGWGNSSPRPKDLPYHVSLSEDIMALIDHLYPDGLPTDFKLYTAGGSYGTVPAQMLYGAPFDIFPYGRYLKGTVLLSPLSPFKYHADYAQSLSTANYIIAGPPSRWIPFNIIPRLTFMAMSSKVRDEESAAKFVHQSIFSKMEGRELADFTRWKEKYGKADGEFEHQFAANLCKSIAKSREGFMEGSDVLHSDWGFDPARLDDEHNKRLILICSATGDDMASDGMAKWLSEAYKNAHWESLDGGGHIAAYFRFDEIWEKLFSLTDRAYI